MWNTVFVAIVFHLDNSIHVSVNIVVLKIINYLVIVIIIGNLIIWLLALLHTLLLLFDSLLCCTP